MVTTTGHAYPWDVIGDPGFTGRVSQLGLTSVTIASAYHSARAATPLHPRHQIVHAHHAALYRPIREEAWHGSRLKPQAPDWMTEPDPFGRAAEILRAAGLRVSAWVVLTHNTRLGLEYGELAVTNCFGDGYPYALCPAQPEVRRYAAKLAAEAVAGVELDGISLEACGQLGLDHNSHHEKTGDAWKLATMRALSICCCTACRAAWTARGLDPAEVITTLRHTITDGTELPADLADELLATRHDAADQLRAEVLDQLSGIAPDVPITLHGHPDPWVTGASPGLTQMAAKSVDAILVPAWSTHPSTAETVTRAAALGTPVDAYVTVLPPAEPDEVGPHVRRLVEAGASRLSLYHLGLAPAWRQSLIRDVIEQVSDLG